MTVAEVRHAGQWPATPIQRWMRAHDESNPTSGYYVLPFTWRLGRRVDWPCFTRAFAAVCARYPVLTASLRRAGSGAGSGSAGQDSWVQAVRPYDEVPVRYLDAGGAAGEARERLLRDSYDEYCRRPFRLTEEPPIRVLVVQLADDAVVLGAYHQAVCDIESMAVFVSEFRQIYAAYLDGTEPDLPDPGLEFGTFARRTEPELRAQLARNLAYWQTQLAGAALRCPLPVDFPEAAGVPIGDTEYVKIGGPPTARAVHAAARELRCSEHAVLLAAFALVLARHAGVPSLVVSCPVSLRRSAGLLRTVGPLTDLLWIRVDVDASGGFAAHARRTFQGILRSLAHPCPIDMVADGVVAGGAGPNVQCQFFPAERVANPEWVQRSVQVTEFMPVHLLTGPLQSPFWLDLTIAGERNQPDTDYSLVYRTDLFRPDTARGFAGQIEALLTGGVRGGG